MAITLRDPNQIVSAEHDEKNDAKRVIIVGGEIPEFKIPEIKLPDLSSIRSIDTKIEKIEIPVIIKETQIEKIEVPVIIKEIEVREIEKQVPIIVKEIHIERIEVPVPIKQYETIQIPSEIKQISTIEKMPRWAFVLIFTQSIIITIAILLKFLK